MSANSAALRTHQLCSCHQPGGTVSHIVSYTLLSFFLSLSLLSTLFVANSRSLSISLINKLSPESPASLHTHIHLKLRLNAECALSVIIAFQKTEVKPKGDELNTLSFFRLVCTSVLYILLDRTAHCN